ncbi:complement C1q-like protein 4 [Ruditapes philippinarum]|uniref:complement C1q-like protein 4 n=1 Tax=Ruditapes philippinarum TaxID=129788 RepID=UPI00295B0C5E|nr:complement C1q-like protein 4 [Ruditapes philippinarum]
MMLNLTYVSFVIVFFCQNSFSVELNDDTVIPVIQSIVDELKNVKATYRIETDQLRNEVFTLQKENKELTSKVQQLIQDRDRHKKICDENNNIGEHKVNSDRMSGSITIPQPHPGTLGNQKRQIPADGRVAFTSVLSNQIPHLGSHQTVIFDSVVTNIGNAYHSNSGIFVAPYKGAYVFTVKMKVPPRHKLHLELVVDGKVAFDLGIEIPSSEDYESANEEFIIEVNQGADVFVRSDARGGVLYGYRRSVFSGFLLFETE